MIQAETNGYFQRHVSRPVLWLCAVMAVLLIATVAWEVAAPWETDAPPYAASELRVPTRLPLVIRQDTILIEARLNGGRPGWYILDTGSEVDLVPQAAAAAAGLKRVKPDLNVNGLTNQWRCVGASIQIGPANYRPRAVLGLAGDFFERMSRQLAHPVDGLLGIGLFTQYAVTLDYQKQEVVLQSPDWFQPPPGAMEMPLRERDHKLLAWGEIYSRGKAVPAEFMLDTGHNCTATLSASFCQQRGVRARALLDAGYQAMLQGIVPVRRGVLERLDFGGVSWTNLPANFEGRAGVATFSPSGAVLGNGLLRQFRITLNHAVRRMYLEKTPETGRRIPP